MFIWTENCDPIRKLSLWSFLAALVWGNLQAPNSSHVDFQDGICSRINESLSGFLQKSQTPKQALWSLCSIDLWVIALHPSFVKLRMPQKASLVTLISEPIRVNVFSFVTWSTKWEFAVFRTGIDLYTKSQLSINTELSFSPLLGVNQRRVSLTATYEIY